MNAIDRVMLAYAKVYKLTDRQADTVRKELSHFIDQLRNGRSGSSDNQARTTPPKSS